MWECREWAHLMPRPPAITGRFTALPSSWCKCRYHGVYPPLFASLAFFPNNICRKCCAPLSRVMHSHGRIVVLQLPGMVHGRELIPTSSNQVLHEHHQALGRHKDPRRASPSHQSMSWVHRRGLLGHRTPHLINISPRVAFILRFFNPPTLVNLYPYLVGRAGTGQRLFLEGHLRYSLMTCAYKNASFTG